MKYFVIIGCCLTSSTAIQTIRTDLNNVSLSNSIEFSVDDILILKFGAADVSPFQVLPSADTGIPDYSYFCPSQSSAPCPLSMFRPNGSLPAQVALGRRAECYQGNAISPVAGLFVFQPTLEHAGTSYTICMETYSNPDMALACANLSVVVPRPTFTNVTINGDPAAPLGWQTVETAAGCQTAISFRAVDDRVCRSPGCVVPAMPAPGAAPASCSGEWERSSCAVGCGRLQVRPIPQVEEGYPLTATGLPDFAQLGPAEAAAAGGAAAAAPDGAQWWRLVLAPLAEHSSQVPYRLCLAPGLVRHPRAAAGAPLCVAVHVRKCRYCARPGETLQQVASTVQADWLQLFLANPALPGHDPDRLPPGLVLRLGVPHPARAGDTLAGVAARLLAAPAALLASNPELWARARLAWNEEAAGRPAHALLELRPRRALCGLGALGCGLCYTATRQGNASLPGVSESETALCSRGSDLAGAEGDTVAVTLPAGFEGPAAWRGNVSDWAGTVEEWAAMSEPCAEVQQTVCEPAAAGDACDCSAAAPETACAAGGWGVCRYDDAGAMRCLASRCANDGQHPLIESASWDGATATLTLTVRRGVRIEAGRRVVAAVAKSSGIRFPRAGAVEATRAAAALFPVPLRVDAPAPPLPTCAEVVAQYGAEDAARSRPCRSGGPDSLRFPQAGFELCALLPACDENVQCVMGADCVLRGLPGAGAAV